MYFLPFFTGALSRLSGVLAKLFLNLIPLDFTYGSAYLLTTAFNPRLTTDYQLKDPSDFLMESHQATEAKKRSLGLMHAQELAYKFKSKQDFIVYLDQQ